MRKLPDRGPLRQLSETELRLDLHGYDVLTAVELASACAASAWEHGFGRLTIVHGARDQPAPRDVEESGRGVIKWAVRAALDDGDFDTWAQPPRRGNHRRGQASETSIELRPNPDPDPDAEWPPIPEPQHW